MDRNGQMEQTIFGRTSPTEKSGPPGKVDRLFGNLFGWAELK